MVDKQPTTRWCCSECGDTWSIHAVQYLCGISCWRSQGRDNCNLLCFSALVCICPCGRTLRREGSRQPLRPGFPCRRKRGCCRCDHCRIARTPSSRVVGRTNHRHCVEFFSGHHSIEG